MSCGHGNGDGDNYVIFNGKKLPIQLVKVEYEGNVDLALFFLPGWNKPKYTFRVAEKSPAIGRDVKMIGYPWTRLGNYRITKGEIEETRIIGYSYQFNRAALNGESGGPVLDLNEKIVGIVSARVGGDTLVTEIPEIRKFLSGIITTGVAPAPPTTTPTPPKDCPPRPVHNHADLLAKIQSLELQLQRVREDFDILKLRQGPIGPQGLTGDDGAKGDAGATGGDGSDGVNGAVTIILTEDGEELQRVEDVRAGSTVRLNVNRKKKGD